MASFCERTGKSVSRFHSILSRPCGVPRSVAWIKDDRKRFPRARLGSRCSPPDPRELLLDLDGTLFDTLHAHWAATKRAQSKIGHQSCSLGFLSRCPCTDSPKEKHV